MQNPKEKSHFKSVFKFEEQGRNKMESDYYAHTAGDGTPLLMLSIAWLLTGLSWAAFLLCLPVTWWFCVKQLSEHDRMVIFRLGKMLRVKGPGRVVTFPWLDCTKRVDTRASAFSVPPQQFITVDGGIMEMGGEVQYEITDVQTMVREVADHQDILRSLGRSLATKVLTKKTVHQLMKDRRLAAQQVLDELNTQVRKWGVDIRQVTLSEPKLLKKPEDRSALGPVLQNIGLKEEQEFPSPEQFIRNNLAASAQSSDETDAAALNKLASAVGGMLQQVLCTKTVL